MTFAKMIKKKFYTKLSCKYKRPIGFKEKRVLQKRNGTIPSMPCKKCGNGLTHNKNMHPD
jgi:hypothetical protein